jgi:hypothetical protein
MPTIASADALIKAADNLVDTILGKFPQPTPNAHAVEQLIDIFKVQAEKATCEARSACILQEQAQAQRVQAESQRVLTESPHNIPELLIEETSTHTSNNRRGVPLISQDEEDYDDNNQSPSENTRLQQHRGMLTQEYMMHMVHLPIKSVTQSLHYYRQHHEDTHHNSYMSLPGQYLTMKQEICHS